VDSLTTTENPSVVAIANLARRKKRLFSLLHWGANDYPPGAWQPSAWRDNVGGTLGQSKELPQWSKKGGKLASFAMKQFRLGKVCRMLRPIIRLCQNGNSTLMMHNLVV
jgi:hypothetical protein